MLDLVEGIRPAVVTALGPMPGGLYRKDDPDGNARVPSWWLHADSAGNLNRLQDVVPVSLDIWHGTIGDLDAALKKLEWLREHDVLGVGSYRRESVAVQHEDRNVHHATVTLVAVRFAVA